MIIPFLIFLHCSCLPSPVCHPLSDTWSSKYAKKLLLELVQDILVPLGPVGSWFSWGQFFGLLEHLPDTLSCSSSDHGNTSVFWNILFSSGIWPLLPGFGYFYCSAPFVVITNRPLMALLWPLKAFLSWPIGTLEYPLHQHTGLAGVPSNSMTKG